jgi:hypothetical protein
MYKYLPIPWNVKCAVEEASLVKHPVQIILCSVLLNRHVFVEMTGFVYVTINLLAPEF